MAGGRAGKLHLGVGGDAAVELAVAHHLPLAAVLADLDDGAAMGRHLDVDLLLAERRHLGCLLAVLVDDLDDAGEHQMRVGVLVVDHQQAMLGRAVDRDIADIVVVVAELFCLGLGRLLCRVEFRRVGKQRIAPAQQHVGIVARRDMVLVVDAGLQLVEGEGRGLGSAGIVGGDERQRADRGGDGRNGQRTLQETTAREARGDDLAHGAVVGGIDGRAVILLELAGSETGVRGAVVGHELSSGFLAGACDLSTPITAGSHFRDTRLVFGSLFAGS